MARSGEKSCVCVMIFSMCTYGFTRFRRNHLVRLAVLRVIAAVLRSTREADPIGIRKYYDPITRSQITAHPTSAEGP